MFVFIGRASCSASWRCRYEQLLGHPKLKSRHLDAMKFVHNWCCFVSIMCQVIRAESLTD